MTARHLLALAQNAGACRQIVVPHLGGRRHRRIGEAQGVGDKLEPGIHAERIGLLGKRDDVLVSVGEAAHDDARQPVLALQPHQPVAQHREGQDVDTRSMRHELAPAMAGRGVERRHHDLEILGAVRIGANEQHRLAAEIGMVLDVVLHRRLARGHQHAGPRRRASDR